MTPFAFMGTPEFSTIILDHLEASGFLPALCVTQPDRPCGRGRKMTPSQVALWAQARDLPILKPQNSRDPLLEETLSALSPVFVLTAAFGLILPASLLALPSKGCLNLHASLLPRYRGASPVQAALLAGDKETGVSLMRMDEGLDTGPVLARASMAIPQDMDAGQLNLELAHLGGRLMASHILPFLDGQVTEEVQDERLASMTHLLKKADGEVDFSLKAQEVHNHIRAMNPWPGAFAFLQGKRYKLIRARLFEGQLTGQAGQVHILGRRMVITCGEGALELLDIQAQSGAVMACEACAHNFESGSVFDPCRRSGHELEMPGVKEDVI